MTFECFFIPLIDAVGVLADRLDESVDKLLSLKISDARATVPSGEGLTVGRSCLAATSASHWSSTPPAAARTWLGL